MARPVPVSIHQATIRQNAATSGDLATASHLVPPIGDRIMNREILARPFPEALIRSRKGPFNQTFSYVEGAEYIRRLNDAFESEWSFEIVQHHIRDTEVLVIGQLTAAGVTKMAFGGSSITVSREGEVVSIADDLKAAATDALKKAASLLGVGLHLYISEPEIKPSIHAPQPKPDGKGNGNGRKNGDREKCANGTVVRDRLTQKQLSAIWGMARSLGLSADAVRQRSVQAFGVIPEQLSRADASALIGELGEALSSPASSAA
jgi:hypothetical protein